MSDLFINRLSIPIVTGNALPQAKPQQAPEQESGQSFKDILQARLAAQSGVEFSKHAVSRVVERGIEVSESNMSRLNEGVRIAQEKGLNDTLILIDKTAFIVNIKNSKVITTVSEESLKGNVFTNIDGTIII